MADDMREAAQELASKFRECKLTVARDLGIAPEQAGILLTFSEEEIRAGEADALIEQYVLLRHQLEAIFRRQEASDG